MTSPAQTALSFVQSAQAHGFTVSVNHNGVVNIAQEFTRGDNAKFTELDGIAPGLLSELGAKGGSQWGTDGGSVGGMSALTHGLFTLSQSGVPKKVSDCVKQLVRW